MRTIDADALIKWVQECGAKCPTLSVEKLFNKIKDAPTIDAVPVVRCKECRFSVVNENIDRKPLICGKTKMCGETTPDWFCAAGKRSEE